MTTPVLYIHDNGEVACGTAGHGGGYLNSAVAAKPAQRLIRTPLGSWEQVPAAEAAEHGLKCEGCPAGLT